MKLFSLLTLLCKFVPEFCPRFSKTYFEEQFVHGIDNVGVLPESGVFEVKVSEQEAKAWESEFQALETRALGFDKAKSPKRAPLWIDEVDLKKMWDEKLLKMEDYKDYNDGIK